MAPVDRAEPCAHCGTPAARSVCLRCGQPVCHTCLSPTSCTSPRAWSLQLPRGSTLLRVDNGGHLALVRSRRGEVGLFELGTSRRRPAPVRLRHPRSFPWLAEPERLVRLTYTAAGKLRGVGILPLSHHAGAACIPCKPDPCPRDLLLCDQERTALVLHDDEELDLIDLTQLRRAGTVADPGYAIRAADACQAMDLAALGSYGRVSLYRMSDQRPLGALPVFGGQVVWVGVAGGRLVALTDSGHLDARRVSPNRPPSSWARLPLDARVVGQLTAVRERSEQGRIEAGVISGMLAGALGILGFAGMLLANRISEPAGDLASLTPDGRLLAIKVDQRHVEVLRLASQASKRLPLPPEQVSYLRFIRGGRLLVTCDVGGRVCFWPRVADDILDR